MTDKLPDSLEKIAIAKAREEEVLALLAEQARLLEQVKEEARAAAKAAGKTDAEIDAMITAHPAGTFAL